MVQSSLLGDTASQSTKRISCHGFPFFSVTSNINLFSSVDTTLRRYPFCKSIIVDLPRFNPNLTREIVGAVRKGVGKTTVMRFTNACNCVPTNAKPDCTSLCFSRSLHLESLFPRLESLTEVTSIFTAFGLWRG